jgi:hypothetical protein
MDDHVTIILNNSCHSHIRFIRIPLPHSPYFCLNSGHQEKPGGVRFTQQLFKAGVAGVGPGLSQAAVGGGRDIFLP